VGDGGGVMVQDPWDRWKISRDAVTEFGFALFVDDMELAGGSAFENTEFTITNPLAFEPLVRTNAVSVPLKMQLSIVSP
jgi:hypothetical protein